jgi:hypothetical protein
MQTKSFLAVGFATLVVDAYRDTLAIDSDHNHIKDLARTDRTGGFYEQSATTAQNGMVAHCHIRVCAAGVLWRAGRVDRSLHAVS